MAKDAGPTAADRLIDAIVDRFELLAEQPDMGRPASTPNALAFTTDAIENISTGWRARETYIVHGPDEFEEVLELAEGTRAFEVYSRVRLIRVRTAPRWALDPSSCHVKANRPVRGWRSGFRACGRFVGIGIHRRCGSRVPVRLALRRNRQSELTWPRLCL